MAVHVGSTPLPQVVLSRDLGVNAVREAAAHGLVKVMHGAFAAPLADASSPLAADHLARARIRAVSHRLTKEAVFSHESAALVHGLWLLETPAAVHITQSYKPRASTPALRRHAGTLPTSDVVEVQGLPVTSVERTIADLAKSMHPREGLVLADSGMRLLVQPERGRRATAEELSDQVRTRLLAKVEGGPHQGRRQARVVAAYADPFSESPYESVVRWIALSRGLPRPVLQQRFDIRGNTYYTDICWEFELTIDGIAFRLRLIAEYDGEQKYLAGADGDADPEAAAQAVLREKRREDDLRSLADTTVQRFDRSDVRPVEATFPRLCAALPPSYRVSLRPVPELVGLARPRQHRTDA